MTGRRVLLYNPRGEGHVLPLALVHIASMIPDFDVRILDGRLELTPESTLEVPYEIKLYDKTIRDSHHHPTQVMTVNQILSESSNVGTIKIAQMIREHGGLQTLVNAFKSFGFGEYTALGLPKEQKGVLKDPDDWNGTDIGSIPIGQSITVSPVQMWSAYNVIANGGRYVAPKLVRDVVDAEGRHHAPKTTEGAPSYDPIDRFSRVAPTEFEQPAEDDGADSAEHPGRESISGQAARQQRHGARGWHDSVAVRHGLGLNGQCQVLIGATV